MNGGNFLMKLMKRLINNKIFIFIFLCIFFINTLVPISGDDFGNFVSTNGTLSHAIRIAYSYYFGLEGRFIGRIIIMWFTKNKILWDLVQALLFTVLIFSCNKTFKKKQALYILLLGLFFVNHDMFAQGYTWLAGSITYLFPSCLCFYYFITLFNTNEELCLYKKIILSLLCIIIPMFVENIGCAFVFGNLIILIYKLITEKKLDKYLLINFILSVIFIILMISSPGSLSRSLVENVGFNNLSIIKKIMFNIPNFIFYLFVKNTNIIIISLIPILYYFIKTGAKKIYIILFCIIPVIFIINNLYYLFPMKFSFLQYLEIGNIKSAFYIIYLIIYFYFFCRSANYIVRDKRELFFIYFMLIIGFSSTFIMLILPTWGDRIVLFNMFTILYTSIKLIDKIISFNGKFDIIIKVILVCYFIYIFICFVFVYKIDKYRDIYINEQLIEDKNEIEVIRNPIMYIWNNNPDGEYLVRTFKEYKNIDEDKTIRIVNLPYREYLKIIFN